MDLQTLRFFKTIADTESFTAASEALHYAQSNLSTQIKRLEEELGTPLFHRAKRGVSLTGKGKIFYEYAERILRMTDEAASAMADMETARGHLKIGSIEAPALRDLPELIRAYHTEHPAVKLELQTALNDVFPGLVLHHKLDGAFIAGPCEHPDLNRVHLKTDQLVLVGSVNDSSFSAEEILREKTLITFPEGSAFRQRLELFLSSEGIAYLDRFAVINSLGAMISNVIAGLGFGYLPRSIVDDYIRRGLMSDHPFDSPYSELEIEFIYRKDRLMDAAFRLLIGQIEAQAR